MIKGIANLFSGFRKKSSSESPSSGGIAETAQKLGLEILQKHDPGRTRAYLRSFFTHEYVPMKTKDRETVYVKMQEILDAHGGKKKEVYRALKGKTWEELTTTLSMIRPSGEVWSTYQEGFPFLAVLEDVSKVFRKCMENPEKDKKKVLYCWQNRLCIINLDTGFMENGERIGSGVYRDAFRVGDVVYKIHNRSVLDLDLEKQEEMSEKEQEILGRIHEGVSTGEFSGVQDPIQREEIYGLQVVTNEEGEEGVVSFGDREIPMLHCIKEKLYSGTLEGRKQEWIEENSDAASDQKQSEEISRRLEAGTTGFREIEDSKIALYEKQCRKKLEEEWKRLGCNLEEITSLSEEDLSEKLIGIVETKYTQGLIFPGETLNLKEIGTEWKKAYGEYNKKLTEKVYEIRKQWEVFCKTDYEKRLLNQPIRKEKEGIEWLNGLFRYVSEKRALEKNRQYFLSHKEEILGWQGDLSIGYEQCRSRNIAHLDGREDNYFLDQDGRAVLADFGSAIDMWKDFPSQFEGARHILFGDREAYKNLYHEKNREELEKLLYSIDVYLFGYSCARMAGIDPENLTETELQQELIEVYGNRQGSFIARMLSSNWSERPEAKRVRKMFHPMAPSEERYRRERELLWKIGMLQEKIQKANPLQDIRVDILQFRSAIERLPSGKDNEEKSEIREAKERLDALEKNYPDYDLCNSTIASLFMVFRDGETQEKIHGLNCVLKEKQGIWNSFNQEIKFFVQNNRNKELIEEIQRGLWLRGELGKALSKERPETLWKLSVWLTKAEEYFQTEKNAGKREAFLENRENVLREQNRSAEACQRRAFNGTVSLRDGEDILFSEGLPESLQRRKAPIRQEDRNEYDKLFQAGQFTDCSDLLSSIDVYLLGYECAEAVGIHPPIRSEKELRKDLVAVYGEKRGGCIAEMLDTDSKKRPSALTVSQTFSPDNIREKKIFTSRGKQKLGFQEYPPRKK